MIEQDAIDLDGAVDVLELVLADILEGNAQPAKTALRILLHSARHADSSCYCQRLEPCCHVYPITMDTSALNDIADVNPHPKLDPAICRDRRIPRGHCALDLDGATQCVHGTDEQDQQAVACSPYDLTTVFFNLGFNELGMVSIQLS